MRSSQTAALLLASLGLACSTPVAVSYDERADFSGFRTWDWLGGAAPTVDAPGDPPAQLDARLADLVADALRARGFRRARGGADLLVSCHLSVRPQAVLVQTTPALQTLSSMHSDGIYHVQVSSSEVQIHEAVRLIVVVSDRRRKQAIWRGRFERRFREFAPHLESAVSTLLDAFPPASTGPRPEPRETPETILGNPTRNPSPAASGVS